MTTKLNSVGADLLPDVSEEADSTWAKRNAAAIEEHIDAGLKDIAGGRVTEFDPRDPFTFIENARKKFGRPRKTSA
jgi:hypothetical protein